MPPFFVILMRKLTPKQKLFIKEYIVDFNGAQAAIRAGYSPKTARAIACALLTKVYIIAAIKRETDKRAERTEITQDYVLKTIRETIERCRGLETDDDFDSSAVLRGCELLGKHLVMFTDKVQNDGKIDIKITKRIIGND